MLVLKYHFHTCSVQGITSWGGWGNAVLIVIFYLLCRDFMDADMNRTKMIISYLRPLLRLEHPHLEHFIHKSLHHHYIHVHTCQ